MRLLSYRLSSGQFAGTDSYDEMEVDDDMTEREIEDMLWDMAVEYLSPEGYVESIEPLEE